MLYDNKNKIMETVEIIHESIDDAVNRLRKISKQYLIESEKITKGVECEAIEKLEQLGFSNVRSVMDYKNKKYEHSSKIREQDLLRSKSTAISTDVENYGKIYPYHKFIYYSQLVSICEKYGLVLGSVNFYNGDIPKKNAKEIISFDYSLCKTKIFTENTTPLFNLRKKTHNANNENLYICAPKHDFIKGLTQIGIEVFKSDYKKISLKGIIGVKKIKDPIVLLPVKSKLDNQIGFIVISKWGLESDDSELMVGINN